MLATNFSCTRCGRCCQDRSLPLTMQESIAWLESDGQIAIYCEAVPDAPGPLDPPAAHRRKRSFSVPCGSSQLHVNAILVAQLTGNCKNLGDDMACSIYETRPLVCRIYPAEINPFIQLDRASKGCPPEAWISDQTFPADLPLLVEQSRQADYTEAARKGSLCRQLGINVTALWGEGYISHQPDSQTLLAALRKALQGDIEALLDNHPWRLYSPLSAFHGPFHGQDLEIIADIQSAAGYSFLRA